MYRYRPLDRTELYLHNAAACLVYSCKCVEWKPVWAIPRTSQLTATDNAHAQWYKDAGLRWNVFHGLGLCLVIATNVSAP